MHHGSVSGREGDMMQQLQKAGEELQDDEIDAVLERCEQLSLKLREALQTHGTDRSDLCGPGHMLIQWCAC